MVNKETINLIKSEIETLSDEDLKRMYLDVEEIKFNLFLELLDRKLINPNVIFEKGESEFVK